MDRVNRFNGRLNGAEALSEFKFPFDSEHSPFLIPFRKYGLQVLPDSSDPDLSYSGDNLGKTPSGKGRVAVHTGCLPNYLTVSTRVISPSRIKSLLEEKGYIIGSSEHIATAKSSQNFIHISFHPGIEYDISGFLSALDSVMDKLQKESNKRKTKASKLPDEDFPF